jgi:ABC-type dipeptide/oligopeptide/nickel transport system ATPase component
VLSVTERLRVGTGMLLAPMQDPHRLAVVSHDLNERSGGRLALGLGMGYRDIEFDGHGISRKQRLPRMLRALEVLEAEQKAGGATLWMGAQLIDPVRRAGQHGHPILFSAALPVERCRTLAGIWPYWKGRIRLPQGARLLFLPQKPYLPIGTLKHAVSYPEDAQRFSAEEMGEALIAVGLPQLAVDLDRSENWAQVLSGGEQQRLAFARALLTRPDWLFLDEATAALPEEAQDALYRVLEEKLPRTTLVSIGHRAGLAAHHARRLAWSGQALVAAD